MDDLPKTTDDFVVHLVKIVDRRIAHAIAPFAERLDAVETRLATLEKRVWRALPEDGDVAPE